MPGRATTDPVPLSRARNGKGRLTRNTPMLFNLGANEFTSLTADGQVERDTTTRFGIRLPDGMHLERPVSLLAAQALVHLASPDEMAGAVKENPVANAVSEGKINGLHGAWQMLAERVAAVPDYRRRFAWLIGQDEPIHITHIATALADFMTYEFRATDSPFDDFLAGDDAALSNTQLRGMALFYGKAQCSNCHAGVFQTDHKFHAIGMPQIGPGRGHGPGFADHGRGAITGQAEDFYRFRTPSLRNVAATAPYGHSGTYAQLKDMIRHHLDPETALAEYTLEKAAIPGGAPVDVAEPAMADFDEVLNIGSAIELSSRPLSDNEISAITGFLDALTDPTSINGRLGAPEVVPSGLSLPPAFGPS